eukprot:UC4_evm2s1589
MHVKDLIAPIVACPEDIDIGTDSGLDYATVVFEEVPVWNIGSAVYYGAYDNVGVAKSSFTYAPGSRFDVGQHRVVFQAEDEAGNTNSCIFRVTVSDKEPPVPSCPPDIHAFTAIGKDGSALASEAFSGDSSEDNVAITRRLFRPAAESYFPIGASNVTMTVEDAAGNTAACHFVVHIEDIEPPRVDCDDITISTDPGKSSAKVASYISNHATDNSETVFTKFNPALGAKFSIGSHGVVMTATDPMNQTVIGPTEKNAKKAVSSSAFIFVGSIFQARFTDNRYMITITTTPLQSRQSLMGLSIIQLHTVADGTNVLEGQAFVGHPGLRKAYKAQITQLFVSPFQQKGIILGMAPSAPNDTLEGYNPLLIWNTSQQCVRLPIKPVGFSKVMRSTKSESTSKFRNYDKGPLELQIVVLSWDLDKEPSTEDLSSSLLQQDPENESKPCQPNLGNLTVEPGHVFIDSNSWPIGSTGTRTFKVDGGINVSFKITVEEPNSPFRTSLRAWVKGGADKYQTQTFGPKNGCSPSFTHLNSGPNICLDVDASDKCAHIALFDEYHDKNIGMAQIDLHDLDIDANEFVKMKRYLSTVDNSSSAPFVICACRLKSKPTFSAKDAPKEFNQDVVTFENSNELKAKTYPGSKGTLIVSNIKIRNLVNVDIGGGDIAELPCPKLYITCGSQTKSLPHQHAVKNIAYETSLCFNIFEGREPLVFDIYNEGCCGSVTEGNFEEMIHYAAACDIHEKMIERFPSVYCSKFIFCGDKVNDKADFIAAVVCAGESMIGTNGMAILSTLEMMANYEGCAPHEEDIYLELSENEIHAVSILAMRLHSFPGFHDTLTLFPTFNKSQKALLILQSAKDMIGEYFLYSELGRGLIGSCHTDHFWDLIGELNCDEGLYLPQYLLEFDVKNIKNCVEKTEEFLVLISQQFEALYCRFNAQKDVPFEDMLIHIEEIQMNNPAFPTIEYSCLSKVAKVVFLLWLPNPSSLYPDKNSENILSGPEGFLFEDVSAIDDDCSYTSTAPSKPPMKVFSSSKIRAAPNFSIKQHVIEKKALLVDVRHGDELQPNIADSISTGLVRSYLNLGKRKPLAINVLSINILAWHYEGTRQNFLVGLAIMLTVKMIKGVSVK